MSDYQLPMNTYTSTSQLVNKYSPNSQIPHSSHQRSPRFRGSDEVQLPSFQTGLSPNRTNTNDQQFKNNTMGQVQFTLPSGQQQQQQKQQYHRLSPSPVQLGNHMSPQATTSFSTKNLHRYSGSPSFSPSSFNQTQGSGNIGSSTAYIQAMKALQGKIKNFQEKMTDMTQNNEEQRQKAQIQIEHQQFEIKNLKKEIQHLKENIEQQKMENIQEKKNQKEQEIKLQEQILALELSKQELELKYAKSRDETQELIQQIYEKKKSLNEYENDVSSLRRELDESSKMTSFLNKDNDQFKNNLQKVGNQCDQQQKLIDKLEECNQQLEEKNYRLQEQLENSKITNDNHKRYLDEQSLSTKAEYNKKLKEVIEEKTRMLAQINDLKEQLQFHGQANDKLTEKMVLFDSENKEQQQRIEKLENELLKYQDDTQKYQEMNKKLLLSLDQRNEQYDVLDRHLSKEKKKAENYVNKIGDLEQLYSDEKIKGETKLNIIHSQQLQMEAVSRRSPMSHDRVSEFQLENNNLLQNARLAPSKNTASNSSLIRSMRNSKSNKFINDSATINLSSQQDPPQENQQLAKSLHKKTVSQNYFSPRNTRDTDQIYHINSSRSQLQNKNQYPSTTSLSKKRQSQPLQSHNYSVSYFQGGDLMPPSVKHYNKSYRDNLPEQGSYSQDNRETIRTKNSNINKENKAQKDKEVVQEEEDDQTDLKYAKHLRDLMRIEQEVKEEKYKQITKKKKQQQHELELVRRQILDLEVELSKHNIEYQKLADDILHSQRDTFYLDSVRKTMVDISLVIQKKNQHLYNLKRREDELII